MTDDIYETIALWFFILRTRYDSRLHTHDLRVFVDDALGQQQPQQQQPQQPRRQPQQQQQHRQPTTGGPNKRKPAKGRVVNKVRL